MAHEIRLRVWLIGVPPILLLAGIVVWLVTTATARKPPPVRAPLATTGPVDSTPTDRPAVPATVTLPAAAAPGPVAAVVAPTASNTPVPPPEPIPELDALRPPPGSLAWTADQKLAYRQKALDDLATRERLLEREVAAAHQRGDTNTEQAKAATLAYLRAKRAEAERVMATHPARLTGPEQQDAGS
jgi:hypothetical protein